MIDFSQLNGENRSKAMALLHNACEKWGFFKVKNTLEISNNALLDLELLG